MMELMKFGSARRGQVALIVALVVVVGLTIAVSVASRSITTISVSTKEEEHARAFSAAEAGVEAAFNQAFSAIIGAGTSTIPFGNSNVSYTATQLSTVTADVAPGEAVTVDWDKAPLASSFTVTTWSGAGCTPTLASTVITSAGVATHAVYAAGSPVFSKAGNRLVRLRFIGCRASVTISGDAALSFYTVDSLGTSGESASRVQALRSAPAAAGIMDFAVFSGGTIQ